MHLTCDRSRAFSGMSERGDGSAVDGSLHGDDSSIVAFDQLSKIVLINIISSIIYISKQIGESCPKCHFEDLWRFRVCSL